MLVAATFFGGSPLAFAPTLIVGRDLTVVLGPNASGKSTALRALASSLLAPADDPATLSGARNANADISLLFVRLDREQLNDVLAEQLARLSTGELLADVGPTGWHVEGWTVDDSYTAPSGWEDH